ncbi:CPBP family glutamic-type intramembrane protease [Runella sp.]|uniref:CPBP family glutamic-type intramembrane protease n=1 Tax=Runella sp. TaxID=1960881 RepID=UPI003D0EF182
MFNEYLEIIYFKNYKFIIYILILCFGLIHLSNYKFSDNIILISPMLIFPQIVDGIIFSYLRVKYGIAYSILIHSFHNLILIALKYS